VEIIGRWTSTGPDGGTATTLAIDPQHPQVLYAGTPGGVFKSVDGGETWNPRSDGIRGANGLLPDGGIVSLAIGPTDTEVLYAGNRDQVWKTMDGGVSWAALKAGGGEAIAIDPESTATVYVASAFAGIHKTTDGGSTWRTLDFTFGGPLQSIAVHPYRRDTVLVGTRFLGVLVSFDGGETWHGPSPNYPEGVHSFAFDDREPDLVYAGAARGGVFRSLDAGITWRPWNVGLPGDTFRMTSALAADRNEVGTFFATADDGGLYVRSDGDASWTSIAANAVEFEIGSLVASSGTAYVATAGGLFRNLATDRSWRTIATGMRSSRALALAIDPSNPDMVLAGTDVGLRCSADLGRTWNPCSGGMLGEALVNGIAFDPTNPSRAFASACGVHVSTDGGRSWVQTLARGVGMTIGEFCRVLDYGTRIDPARFAVDPSNPDNVFAALGDLFRSTDGGRSWMHVLVTTSETSVNCHGLRAAAVDPLDPSMVYAVEETGGPVKSTNGGQSFPPAGCGLLPRSGFAAIAIDPLASATIYASMDRKLVKSLDSGETWAVETAIEAVWTLVFDPVDPTTLYAGTESGVFVSTDGARTWEPLNDGLLAGPVYDLAIDPRDGRTLLAATDGAAIQRIRLD